MNKCHVFVFLLGISLVGAQSGSGSGSGFSYSGSGFWDYFSGWWDDNYNFESGWWYDWDFSGGWADYWSGYDYTWSGSGDFFDIFTSDFSGEIGAWDYSSFGASGWWWYSGSGDASGYDFCEDAAFILDHTQYCSEPIRFYMEIILAVGVENLDDIASAFNDYSGDFDNVDYYSVSGDFGYSDDYPDFNLYEIYDIVFTFLGYGDFQWILDHNVCGNNGGMDSFETCMDWASDECGLDGIVESFREQFCGDDFLEHLERLDGSLLPESMIEIEENVNCIEIEDVFILMDSCETDFHDFVLYGDLETVGGDIRAAYLQTFTCIRSLMLEASGCPFDELVWLEPILFQRYVSTYIPGIAVTYDEVSAGYEISEPDTHEVTRITSTIFGDPHLRVFGMDTDRYQTCDSRGFTTYFQNTWLQVFGINAPIEDGSRATFLSTVFITVYDPAGYEANNGVGRDYSFKMASYEAYNGDLPTELVDVQSRSDLEVETLGNGGVHIKSVIAGLSITLKNVDNTYMLVLRIAEGQTLGADGLLYAGCRSNEQINRADEIAASRRKRQASIDCGNGPYAEQCEYDYAVTGNEEIALGAINFLDDLVSASEGADSELIGDEEEEAGATSVCVSMAAILLPLAAILLR